MKKRLRKKLNRSGSGFCDICGKQEILEEHHIEGKNIPNPNHSSNIANLCANDHNKVHWGIITIEKWVMSSAGKELLWFEDKESFTGEEAKPYIIQSK